MKPDDIKKSLDNIKPDVYMQTRLAEKLSSAKPKKKPAKKKVLTAVSLSLCAVILVTGIGFGIPKNDDLSKSNGGTAEQNYRVNHMFVLNVSAAETENSACTPIGDDTVVLQDYKLSKEYGSDGLELRGHSESGLEISGENIKSVRYKCETGELSIWDFDMRHYLIQNGAYFDIIVPYTEEYAHKSVDERLNIMVGHIQSGDYDKYFTGAEKKSSDSYAGVDRIYYDDLEYYGITLDFDMDTGNIAEDSVVALGLVSKEAYAKLSPLSESGEKRSYIKEYTFNNVLNKNSEIGIASWCPNVDAVFENPDMPFSAIPHDTLTIEVTYNDGTVQLQQYDFAFNDNGELVIEKL